LVQNCRLLARVTWAQCQVFVCSFSPTN
jgi:hypothetical protein